MRKIMKCFIALIIVSVVSMSFTYGPNIYADTNSNLLSGDTASGANKADGIYNLQAVPIRTDAIEWTFDYSAGYSYINSKLYDKNGRLLYSTNTIYKTAPESFFIRFINLKPGTIYRLVVTPYSDNGPSQSKESWGVTNNSSGIPPVKSLTATSLRTDEIEWTFEFDFEYSYINSKLYDTNGRLLYTTNTIYKTSPKSFFIRFMHIRPGTSYKLVVTPYLNGKEGVSMEEYGMTLSNQ